KRLRAAQDRGQRLERRPREVELRLLRGERYAGGLGVEAQLPRPLLLRAVSLAHPARPDPPGGAELRDLLEEIDVRIEEEGETGREIIDVHSALEARVDIGHAVRKGEGQLLCRGRTCLADV